MAYRRTKEEKLEDERREQRWNDYWIKSRAWNTAHDWLEYLAASDWEKWWYANYATDYPNDEADPTLKKKLQVLAARKKMIEDWIHDDWAEYDKMQHRGWCHKAEEKYQVICLRQEEVKGYDLAVNVLLGKAPLGPKPLTPSEEDNLAAASANIGCGSVIGFILVVWFIISFIANL